MKWRITFLTLLFSVFCSLFVSSSTYAVSDYTVTLDWSSWSSFYLCGGDSGRNCSDYSYFISVPSGSCNGNVPAYVVYNFNDSAVNSYISPCSTVIVPFSNTSNLLLTGGQNVPTRYSGDITITLSESYSSCPDIPEPPSGTYFVTENGTYDISEYEYVDVDVPATEIPGDYDDEFNGVIVAIYTCGAIILVIYFFYCIYRMIIKTAGGV